MSTVKIPQSVGIHDGSFHADEVTACALLVLFNLVDKNHIIRSRDPVVLATCEYVCDVGGIYDPEKKLFDHHQADYKGTYSSAGMVLEYLKTSGVLTQKEYDFFNQSIIQGVDDHDNGRAIQNPGVTSFSQVIGNFAPISYEPSDEEFNQTFYAAFNFAHGHLKRMWERYIYNRGCRSLVEDAMKKYKDCLIFDKALPWQENFFELGGENHTAVYVIMPSGKHWKLRAIPPDLQRRMSTRLPLPEEWAGLSDKDLQKVSGVSGAIFCHKGRFISVWETKEDALKALKTILEKRR
jgi:uncharacterized UPF0160 family protein